MAAAGESAHPLTGAWKKLRWAKVNLDTLQCEASYFFGDPADPDSLRGYLDIEMPKHVPSSKLEAPWHWPLLVGDIVQAYRASLDYLAWELAYLDLRQRGKTRKPRRETAFPLVSDPKWWSWDSPKLIDIGADARKLVESLQPYNDDPPTSQPTEKPPLDWLRDLSNQDKHKALALVLGRAGFVEHSLEYGTPGWAFVSSSETTTAQIVAPDGKVKSEHQVRTAFYMELEKAGRIDWILDGIGPKVTQVLSAFEPFFERA